MNPIIIILVCAIAASVAGTLLVAYWLGRTAEQNRRDEMNQELDEMQGRANALLAVPGIFDKFEGSLKAKATLLKEQGMADEAIALYQSEIRKGFYEGFRKGLH